MYRYFAGGLASLYVFATWLFWMVGWVVLPELSPLAWGICGLTALVGFGCLVGSFWATGLAALGAEVTLGLGLFGTVTGFMSLLDAKGLAGVEEAGMMTALSTTWTGLVFALPLVVQHWLLEQDR